MGDTWRLAELKSVHTSIDNWYSREANKIKYQSQIDEHQSEETVRIYHHELHRKQIRRSTILRLDTPTESLLGHRACADYLERSVEDLLLLPVQLDQHAQDVLLDEVGQVFSEDDN